MITHRHLTEKLVSAGFRETEAKIYAAVILNGKIGATEIAGIIGTSSQNVSTIAQGLIDRHLLVKERAKYCMAEPSKFYELISNQIKDMEIQAQRSRSVLNSILETINFNYTQQSGRPIIKLLNYDQWDEFKEEFFLNESDKIIRFIRTKRYKGHSSEHIKKNDNILNNIIKKGIKLEILTPFIDKDEDKSDNTLSYYHIDDSSIFNDFSLDIYAKNDTVVINRRKNITDSTSLDSTVIKNKEIADSFIELFNFIKKYSTKK